MPKHIRFVHIQKERHVTYIKLMTDDVGRVISNYYIRVEGGGGIDKDPTKMSSGHRYTVTGSQFTIKGIKTSRTNGNIFKLKYQHYA